MSPAEHDRVTREGGQLAVAMITAATSGQVDLAARLLNDAFPEIQRKATLVLLGALSGVLAAGEGSDPGFQQRCLHVLGTAFAS